MKDWFSVDKNGLAKLLERKGKQFVLYELVQNAWDEDTSHVTVKVTRIPNSPYVTVYVSDDNPTGFTNLQHAFTLFAESNKKGDAAKRGRFNLGEKLVLALCRSAEITTTTGQIIFDANGRHEGKKRTAAGSVFIGEMKMTDAEIAECHTAMSLLIQPEHIHTHYVIGGETSHGFTNGVDLPTRAFSAKLEESLPTEIADAEGNMRKAVRKTKVTLHATDMTAYLYEMGIPVVEIDGRFDVNVHQKVPLNFDRDNVPPSYLAKIHAVTVEHMSHVLSIEDVNQSWVKVAIQEEGDQLSNETVRHIADLRFGEKRVSYDPSDPEANNLAVASGYTVIHGGTMSGAEWDIMRRANAILPAGQVTPSKPNSFVPLNPLDPKKYTPGMKRVVAYTQWVARELFGCYVMVVICDSNATMEACYGQRTLTYNLRHLGHKFFDGPLEAITDLMIHEFGHEFASNHLSEEYYHALTKIAAKMVTLALNKPKEFSQYVIVSEDVLLKQLRA